MSSTNKIIRQEQLNRYFTKGVVPIRDDLKLVKEQVDGLSLVPLVIRDEKIYVQITQEGSE